MRVLGDENVTVRCFLPVSVRSVLLYAAQSGVWGIYLGELEEVTKGKLLDRSALPFAQPCLLGVRLSEKSPGSFRRAKILLSCR